MIYHQLCEEIIQVLLECSQFYIQLSIFPAKIEFEVSPKRMFGQLLEELKKGISFKNKDQFIKKCITLNNIRIKMVYKLTLKKSLLDIKRQVKKIKKIHDDIYLLYEEIYDNYRVNFHSFAKDTDWEELTEE